ncbi:MAG: peptide chain release factor N(5)-glutamine methyltransferase [Clostridia bacterium]|nr:peptide chain release factor N(5)-glutamine methyltransferase [Clostridia bacterium]
MTYLELLKRLTDIGADAPSHESAEMIRVLCGKPREWCLANRTADLPQAVDSALEMRAQGIPIQYVLGEAWFYGNRFIVSPDCLIPQPDTEHCVSFALLHLKNGDRVLDLCTGSGCIAISILKENTSVCGTAVDISAPALEIARRNALENGVADRLTFLKSDVLSDDISNLIASADVIVSNPPYINTNVIPTLSKEVQCEPSLALDGGADGMDFYRHFIKNLTKHMKPSAVMILEIGYDQSDRILALCQIEGLVCRLHRDFGGNIRVAEISGNLQN